MSPEPQNPSTTERQAGHLVEITDAYGCLSWIGGTGVTSTRENAALLTESQARMKAQELSQVPFYRGRHKTISVVPVGVKTPLSGECQRCGCVFVSHDGHCPCEWVTR